MTDKQQESFRKQFKELMDEAPQELKTEWDKDQTIIWLPLHSIPVIPVTKKFKGKLNADYLKLLSRIKRG